MPGGDKVSPEVKPWHANNGDRIEAHSESTKPTFEGETDGMPRNARGNEELLVMALAGYESEKAKIDAAIAGIRDRLGRRAGRPEAATDGTGPAAAKRKPLSAAARRRIAAAQRKRWAAIRKGKASPEQPKRKLSAAGRKAIIEATKKRWAAFHKAAKARKAASKPQSRKAAVKTMKAGAGQEAAATA
jgi:hypothetical protein